MARNRTQQTNAGKIESILTRLSSIDTATIYEAAGQEGMIPPEIFPIWTGAKIVGRALTVSCPAGDNLTFHRAVSLGKKGDVIVADAQGHSTGGAWGEVLTVAAQARGIAGLVIDGAVRDCTATAKRGFPVFARGLCIGATTKKSLGLINHRLSFGGTIVWPGDLVIGDADGVVVVPVERAEEILTAALERERREAKLMEQIEAGKTTLELLGLEEVVKTLEAS